MTLETFLKRGPEGRRFTRTAAAPNVSSVTIRVFGKGEIDAPVQQQPGTF
jgi:hypothetical protein